MSRQGDDMDRSNVGAALGALALTALSTAAIIWLINSGWSRLPPWLAIIAFILLAVFVIGSPIYALARWAERRLAQQQAPRR